MKLDKWSELPAARVKGPLKGSGSFRILMHKYDFSHTPEALFSYLTNIIPSKQLKIGTSWTPSKLSLSAILRQHKSDFSRVGTMNYVRIGTITVPWFLCSDESQGPSCLVLIKIAGVVMVPQSHLSTTKEIGFKNANLRWGGTGGCWLSQTKHLLPAKPEGAKGHLDSDN